MFFKNTMLDSTILRFICTKNCALCKELIFCGFLAETTGFTVYIVVYLQIDTRPWLCNRVGIQNICRTKNFVVESVGMPF